MFSTISGGWDETALLACRIRDRLLHRLRCRIGKGCSALQVLPEDASICLELGSTARQRTGHGLVRAHGERGPRRGHSGSHSAAGQNELPAAQPLVAVSPFCDGRMCLSDEPFLLPVTSGGSA